MDILQTVIRFYPYIGGVENYVYHLSINLSYFGHNVKVLSSDEGGWANVSDLQVRKLKYVGKIANTNILPTFPFQALSEEFDVIHTHLPTPWVSDFSALAANLKRKPLILTYHNDITSFGFWKIFSYGYNKLLLHHLLKKAERIIVSQPRFLDSPVLSRYRDKLILLPPGVDTELFKPTKPVQKENAVIFVGRLDSYHEYKNFDALLRALKILKDTTDFKLWVVGSGDLMHHYIRISKDLGLKNKVIFYGDVDNSKLVELYNRSTCLVLPSKSKLQEGFGMVAIEALACATPVIVSEIVGIAEDVEKMKCGIKIKPNEREICKALEILMSQDTKKMGKRGRRLVIRKYSWRKIAKKVEEIYLEVLDK